MVQKVLQEALTSGLLTSCGTESDPMQKKKKSPVKQSNTELSEVNLTPRCNSTGLCFHSWTKIRCVMESGLMTSTSVPTYKTLPPH